MKQEPCYGSATVKLGTQPVELARGDTFIYKNTDSKQTSMCKTYAPSDPVGRALCWVQAVYKGSTGWLPIARGPFKDAFCSADTTSEIQSFVVDTCGEWRLVKFKVENVCCHFAICVASTHVYMLNRLYMLCSHCTQCLSVVKRMSCIRKRLHHRQ
jgi:hypothetical protein